MIDSVAATVTPLAKKTGNALVANCADEIGTIHSDLTKVRRPCSTFSAMPASSRGTGR
ncbi:hypothetical protein [Bradyrhizobium diazoefficiens]